MSEPNKAEFLWPHSEGSIAEAGYEFVNAQTEGYRKQWWDILYGRMRARYATKPKPKRK